MLLFISNFDTHYKIKNLDYNSQKNVAVFTCNSHMHIDRNYVMNVLMSEDEYNIGYIAGEFQIKMTQIQKNWYE